MPEPESDRDRDARTDREDRIEERDDRDRAHAEATEDRGHARDDVASALLDSKRRIALVAFVFVLFFAYQVYAKSTDSATDPVLRKGVACLIERMDQQAHPEMVVPESTKCEEFLREIN